MQVQGQILAQYDSGTWGYVLPDHLGSVRTETDDLGQVTVARLVDPFGVPLGADGGSPFGYTGEQWDASTGLVFLRARYYDPAVGRFVSKDTRSGDSRQPLSQNLYLYVSANPTNLVDPTGLTEWRPSTSWVERIIERVYEQGRPEIHLECIMPIGYWQPDILNSSTGEVFEIKPLGGGSGAVQAWTEAEIYATALNRLKAGTILGRETGLLPQNAPNNWNVVNWHTGSPSSFPPLYIPGRTLIPTAYGTEYINAAFDLVAISVLPGSVTWSFVPKPGVTAAALAIYLARKYWSRHVIQGAQTLKEGAAPCPPVIIVVPEFLIDPTNPYNPTNPLNCWDHPEYCTEPIEG